RRLPSWFGMTTGSPPSTTATTELVVPKSIPMTLAMSPFSSVLRHFGGLGGSSPDPPTLSTHLDLDLARLDRLDLRKPDLQHAVAVARPHLVRLHGDGQLDVALEVTRPALDSVVVLLLGLGLGHPPAVQREHVADDREVNLTLLHSRQLGGDHEVVLGLV